MLPDDLLGSVALDPLGSRVPGEDDTVLVQQKTPRSR
jgi:hypothetical protein